MIPSQAVAQSDSYLLQRIQGATPEQLCVLLLEGAQRFLLQAINATKNRNIADKARFVNRVSAIIEELTVQLNQDEENELAINLTRIYEWWMNQLFEGSRNNEYEKMEKIYTQMDSIKATWEELIHKSQSAQPPPAAQRGFGEDLMG
ncbi:MAG: flagellar export chaperone FliS [Holophagales bacterium]|jgi:flagellar protein FliS|nr:flagellar export chaperone FliS [Holophagales bacterium]